MSAVAPAGDTPPRSARWLPVSLLAALCVYIALTWLLGGADTVAAARRIGATWILIGLALTTLSFGIRALRWQFLLGRMGSRVPVGANIAVYLAGIGLSATPGKVGETVRSAFLVRFGVPVGTSLAAFLGDRLSDLHAVLLLALVPLAWQAAWGDAAPWALVLAAVAVGPLGLRWAVKQPPWGKVVDTMAATRLLRRPADWLRRGAADFVRLWRPGAAIPSIGLSIVAYGLQAGTFAGMVAQVAPEVSAGTAIAIFGAATLAGAASFIPGGVGAMELAMVLLLRQQGVDPASGLAAALCLRAVTFWFGLLLGAAGLGIAGRLKGS